MTDQSDESATSAASPPDPVSLHLTAMCPQCGGSVDWTIAAVHTAVSAPAAAAPSALGERHARTPWLRYLFPFTAGWAAGQILAPQSDAPKPVLRRVPTRLRVLCAILPLFVGVAWLTLSGLLREQQVAHSPQSDQQLRKPLQLVRTATPVWDTDQAAVLAIVTAYNAADSRVAATLSLDPIQPYVDPTGPLLVQRRDALAKRQQVAGAYEANLVRWTVGAITIDRANTQATVTTQETWEARTPEHAAQTATLRVVYTLKRATAGAAWHIYAAERLPVGVPSP